MEISFFHFLWIIDRLVHMVSNIVRKRTLPTSKNKIKINSE